MKKIRIESSINICSIDELSTAQRLLIEKAKEQVKKAYAPYSEFQVGASVLLENGEIFSGSNQENAAYPSGLCAERVALFYANAQHPTIAPTTIAIAAFAKGKFLEKPISPCGACRQVLSEVEMRFNKNIILLLYGESFVYVIENTQQILPLGFNNDHFK